MATTLATRDPRLEDIGKLGLRLVVGVLLLFHGFDKVHHGIAGIAEELGRVGLPRVMAYGVFVGELFAPILILLGVWTRPAALVSAATILFATLLVHARDYTRLAPTGGWAAELHVFYVLSALAVAFLGAGRYSLRGGRGRFD